MMMVWWELLIIIITYLYAYMSMFYVLAASRSGGWSGNPDVLAARIRGNPLRRAPYESKKPQMAAQNNLSWGLCYPCTSSYCRGHFSSFQLISAFWWESHSSEATPLRRAGLLGTTATGTQGLLRALALSLSFCSHTIEAKRTHTSLPHSAVYLAPKLT